MTVPSASCNGTATAQRDELERKYADRMHAASELARLVSYVGNRRTPLLRLYRYKEAFSQSFVQHFMRFFELSERDYVLDPFCGMGTTLLTSWLHGIPSVGLDRLPVAAFVAQTLPQFSCLERGQIARTYERLLAGVAEQPPAHIADDVRIIPLAFPARTLTRLRQWYTAISGLQQPLRDIFRLLFYAILEETSFTSKDGQFLRLTRSRRPAQPDAALLRKCQEAEDDLAALHYGMLGPADPRRAPLPEVHCADARGGHGFRPARAPTAIITSPPYANRYDYTRTYCLELCFGFTSDFRELRAVRQDLLRSHIESKLRPGERPAHPAVAEVITSLSGHHLNNPRIPDMLIAYFADMASVVGAWSEWMAQGGRVAMVVDNVRFHGEHVPVDLILCDLAAEVGFVTERVVVARYKGNSSQQMGKYGRFPVRESVLIWRKV